jgi:hypothetical protein
LFAAHNRPHNDRTIDLHHKDRHRAIVTTSEY